MRNHLAENVLDKKMPFLMQVKIKTVRPYFIGSAVKQTKHL